MKLKIQSPPATKPQMSSSWAYYPQQNSHRDPSRFVGQFKANGYKLYDMSGKCLGMVF